MNLPGNELVTHCISVEHCERSETGVDHLHAFIEFSLPLYILELCEYLREVYNGCKLDVQPCRCKKSCFKYVSKCDVWLITNVKTSSLHFNYQCFVWATNTIKVDCTDPFVVMHRFQYKFLERYLLDFQKRKLKFLWT